MCESRRLCITVEGERGLHLSYWEHHRTNYRPFCSQTQIKYLQDFHRILVDVKVLREVDYADYRNQQIHDIENLL